MNNRVNPLRTGLLFISPWIVGFLILTLYPFGLSLYLSFTDYSVLSSPVPVGVENYRNMVTDRLFWQALYNTFAYAALAIPLGLSVAFSLAVLLNFNLPGKGVFRTIYFIPSLVPLVALAVLWQWLLNGELGLVNAAIRPFTGLINQATGLTLEPPNWLQDARYARLGLVMTGAWSMGNAVVIFLAGLQDVPRDLYESAELDGAGFWGKTRHITIPMLMPVIYFNGIMGLIGSFQVFAVPYVITGGGDGPGRSLLFIATYVYKTAFDYWSMGYACAMALILFLIILSMTLLMHRFAEKHIHYAGKA
jgi:multiple sugar transport system permease protein